MLIIDGQTEKYSIYFFFIMYFVDVTNENIVKHEKRINSEPKYIFILSTVFNEMKDIKT